jgi:hypothetical protein
VHLALDTYSGAASSNFCAQCPVPSAQCPVTSDQCNLFDREISLERSNRPFVSQTVEVQILKFSPTQPRRKAVPTERPLKGKMLSRSQRKRVRRSRSRDGMLRVLSYACRAARLSNLSVRVWRGEEPRRGRTCRRCEGRCARPACFQARDALCVEESHHDQPGTRPRWHAKRRICTDLQEKNAGLSTI